MFAIEFMVFLLPGTYNATQVDLPPFFSGGLASTNDDVNGTGVVQNFLDDGGADADDGEHGYKWHELEPAVSSHAHNWTPNVDHLVF